MRVRWLLGAWLLLCAVQAPAFEDRPGLLEFREVLPGLYDYLWKKPLGGESELEISPRMPVECHFNSASRGQRMPETLLVRGRLQCPDGLMGKTVAIEGLAATRTDVLVRVLYRDGRRENYLLGPLHPTATFADTGTVWQQLLAWARLGFEELLLGADHLLFLLGLVLIAAGAQRAGALLAFAVAHGAGLAAVYLGYLRVAPLPLDAVIALGMLLVGAEAVRRCGDGCSFTLRHPWVAAIGFGLLHGFAFAGGLGGVRDEHPLALPFFAVGLEAALLLFVLLVLMLQRALRATQGPWPWLVAALPGYLIGTLGACWALQRTLLVLGVLK